MAPIRWWKGPILRRLQKCGNHAQHGVASSAAPYARYGFAGIVLAMIAAVGRLDYIYPNMNETREQEALQAYLNLLRNKGADEQDLERRAQLLQQLLPIISDAPSQGQGYRNAVEALLDRIGRADWPYALSVVREFYPFWTRDIKTIAALNAEAAFGATCQAWQPPDCDLSALWGSLDQERFGVAENWPLKAYTQALRQEGAAPALVETRVKLVKLLLLRLRDAPDKSAMTYRAAVDATVPLFELKETRRLFLAVVREFYYFWIGDPEAVSHVLQDAADAY